MSDQTILNRATLILRRVGPDKRADEVLREELSFHRNWSSVEVRAIVRAVNAYFRWYVWLPRMPFQGMVEEALRLQDRFDADEANIKVEALRARAVPEWLKTEMELPQTFLRQLQRNPALWLRARIGFEQQIMADLGDCVREEINPFGTEKPIAGVRYIGTRDLFRSPSFKEGFFEIQDLSSQCVSWYCAPQPGETWWDACAGEGGKTLHLADMMQNKGLVWASDRSNRRLQTLQKRAARAQVFNFRPATWEGDEKLPTKTPFDGILVDAPCSGVGTWQRNPQARWTVQPTDVEELSQVQKRLLTHAATVVKPGGRLVYSVCTLTRSETEGVVESFSRANEGFKLLSSYTLMPGEINANGMYVAQWRKE